jgi:flagellar export protein FliJ
MKPFRFRAATILDLRRREEDEARAVFARASAAEHTAAEHLEGISARAEQGRANTRELYQGTAPAWLVGWHQSWMFKQRLELDARRRELTAASAVVAQANTALRTAFRRRRVLERLRERALHRYTVESERQETREMNLLAGLRHLAQAAETEGARSEHEQY